MEIISTNNVIAMGRFLHKNPPHPGLGQVKKEMCKAKSLAGLLYNDPLEEAVRNCSEGPEHKLETIQHIRFDNVLSQLYSHCQAYCMVPNVVERW